MTKIKAPIEFNNKQKLFGTDGIRGTANEFPITPHLIMKVGQAVGLWLREQPNHKGHRRMVLIGKDTRLSGYMVEQALASGLNSMGIHVQLTGPLPTPGIGFLARNMRVDAGIIISASHNPFHDNGIKIFGADGFKIDESVEKQIEHNVIHENLDTYLVDSSMIGRTRRIEDATGRYIVYVKNSFPIDLSLEGMRIVLDCANGAAYRAAPAIFEELGAEMIVLGSEPDGYNINDKSGALYPQNTCDAVVKYRADVGIAIDGDADRVIMVDEKGEVVNGDHILAICAIHMAKRNMLSKNTVVATQMSNIGLDQVLKSHGVQVVRTDVGDKNVVEEMRRGGYTLGGEQSGHVIHLEHSTTGDGCVAALNVLAVMQRENRKLSDLKDILQERPQILQNVRVGTRRNLEQIAGYQELIKKIETQLGEEGRIYIRFSGTEPVIRILVEGPDPIEIHRWADEVAVFLKAELN
ncbi:MAG: phosphoglucosamine mutase [Bdellovibrionales bacterium]|nr:phosphoglucosamine mutase [Bdellovibrionales bacterium]